MKKGFLCILLSLLMILPLLTACNKEADLSGSEVNIYTLYTIVGEETSPEAIRQVELSLNRILFYRLGVILDLQMVTEDEYDEFIEGKLAELEAYTADKSNNPYAENVEKYPGVMTGDRVLDMLENGEDIVLKRPRVDAFLVRGYDDYYELATNQKLAELDARMDYEAKELKSQIHTTLRDAAKINGKTYGIPINTGIGEYMQLVVDKELAEKYNLDLDSVESLADLEGFLDSVSKEEGVVPLMLDEDDVPKGFNYIISNGFPALVDSNDTVIDAYTNVKLREYFALLAKYYSKGYVGDNNTENSRCAVSIEFGTETEILINNDNKVICKEYSAPIADNTNTLKNLFCVPVSANNEELAAIVTIINEINTNADLMNLITYGVQKTHGIEAEDAHYELNDNNQVERFEENPYIVNPDYIGNCFITHTLDGEDPEKWQKLIEQNKNAIPSPSLGFSMTPVTFTYTEKVVDEDGNTETKTVTIYEPDYVSIISGVIDKYYPGLMNGSFIASKDFNFEEKEAELRAKFEDEVTAALDKAYGNRLYQSILEDEINKINANETIKADLMADASDIIYSEDVSDAVSYFESLAATESSEESPELSSDAEVSSETEETSDASESSDGNSSENSDASITDDSSAESTDVSSEDTSDDASEAEPVITITDEMLTEYREFAEITDEKIANRVNTAYNNLVKEAAAKNADSLIGTPAYEQAFEKLKDAANENSEYSISLKTQVNYKVEDELNILVQTYVKAYTEEMIKEINATLKTEMDAFVSDYVEKRRAAEEDTTDSETSDAVVAEIEPSDDTAAVDESTVTEEDSVVEDSSSDITNDEPSEDDSSKDDFYKSIEEEVYLKIGFWEKIAVTPEDNTGSDTSDTDTSDNTDAADDGSNSETTESDTTEAETSDTTESEDDTDGEVTEDGDSTTEVITKPYKDNWLDFVVKGKVAKAYYALHPRK